MMLADKTVIFSDSGEQEEDSLKKLRYVHVRMRGSKV